MAAVAIALPGCEGRPRVLSAPRTQRIVSLAPATTETIFALGAGAEVAGVSQYCDYPPEVARLPKVGTFITPNIEAIAGLRPTIVIGLASSSDVREVRALEAMGYRTLAVNGDTIAGIEASIRAIGNAIGRSREARALLDRMHLQIAAIEERLRDVPVRRVLMVVGHQPMVAVGRATYLGELLTMVHAANIADAAAQSWPRLSLEYIIAMKPEVILDGQMGSEPSARSNFWAKYPAIPAVHDRRVIGYPDDPTLHPGPRIVQTLDLLARLVHPEAFTHAAAVPQRAGGSDLPEAIALEPAR